MPSSGLRSSVYRGRGKENFTWMEWAKPISGWFAEEALEPYSSPKQGKFEYKVKPMSR